MIDRRMFAAGSAAFLALSAEAAAQPSRIALTGSPMQGGLSVGRTEPGATVSIDGYPILVSPEGLFAFGIAYYQTAPVIVRAEFADGTGETRTVVPIVRKYEVQVVNGLPQKLVTPPPEDLARIRQEHARLAQARTVDTAEIWFSEPLLWPFPGIISGLYGSRRIDNGTPMAPHLGVDIAAPAGTPIHAPAGARVAIAEPWLLEGNFTMLDHGHGVFTEYLHQSRFLVKAGDLVERGQPIGLVGATGRATGPHSHWGLSWFEIKLDPSLSTATPLPPRS